MSKGKWTPEPWVAEPIRDGQFYAVRGSATPHKHQVCRVSPGICGCSGGARLHGPANAARIVACVNGCEGVNPAAVPDLLAACRAALTAAQLDEWEHAGSVRRDAWDQLRYAVTKAGGAE